MTNANSWQMPLDTDASIVERFDGGSNFLLFLVEAQAGLSPEAERKVADTLEAVHATRPIQRLFITFDASAKWGMFDRQINVEPYRAFPNKGITRSLAHAFIDQSWSSAGFTFAVICEPETRLETADDFYGWAMQCDTMNELNGEASKIALVAQLADAMIPDGSARAAQAKRLLALLRLNMTMREWSESREELNAIRPAEALQDLAQAIPQFDVLTAAIDHYQSIADCFYEQGLVRAKYMAHEATRRVCGAGDDTGALVTPHPWTDVVAAQLRHERASFIRLRPTGVQMTPMLAEAARLVGGRPESSRMLDEHLLGQRVRNRIEALSAKERENRKHRSSPWITAALQLSEQKDVQRARECAARAIELYPDAEAYRSAGIVDVDHGHFTTGLALFQRAIELDWADPLAWEGYGVALLYGFGRRGAAWLAFLRSLYLRPSQGRYWFRLGAYYSDNDRVAACYCFRVARSLKDERAQKYLDLLCRDVKPRCPFVVRRPVIAFIRHIVLPILRLARSLKPVRHRSFSPRSSLPAS
jgi:tetratricopeptide (TPR) repeat protein